MDQEEDVVFLGQLEKKPKMQVNNILNKGPDKAYWNQDNINKTSFLALSIGVGCSPFQGALKLQDLIIL